MKSILYLSLLLVIFGCKNEVSKPVKAEESSVKTINTSPEQPLSKAFKDYWHKGEAEISSYKLEQNRYGEIRDGEAVLIYVTEPFLKNEQVKANSKSDNSVPVLKLNATKNFITGIYPYSILQSTFYPTANNQNAIKVSSSIQEWCGHTYMQINNRDQFKVTSHSYFEGEADENFNIEKNVLENQFWTQLRINPKSLPVGDFKSIPSLEFLKLNHTTTKAYKASAKLTDSTYNIAYPELNRELNIHFSKEFPHTILGWTETVNNQTSKATLLKTITSPYWNKKQNKDVILRDSLLLK